MRSIFFRFKKPPTVPDKGQRIRLLTDNGKWIGGYRAASYPVTSQDGEGAIWVAEEAEFWEAKFEGRLAEAELWPISKVKVPENHQRWTRRRMTRI